MSTPHVPVPRLLRWDDSGERRVEVPLDRFARVQSGMSMELSYPTPEDGSCACGCGEALGGRRRRWQPGHSETAFRVWAIYAGRSGSIRRAVYARDRGRCSECDAEKCAWEADHVVPVVEGGGACGLSGYRTLCIPCHQAATAALARRRAHRRRAGYGHPDLGLSA